MSEGLWTITRGGHVYSARLEDRGPRGVKGQLYRDGWMVIAWRHETAALARQWLDEERARIDAEHITLH